MITNQEIISKLTKRFYYPPPKDALNAAFAALVKPGMKVLDAGCSSQQGFVPKDFVENVYVVGIDIDQKVEQNPYCNEVIVGDLSKKLPFPDASFDIVYCRWVMEHIEKPDKTFREFSRILKPGGYVLVLTPNIFHYAMIASRITPYWFHLWWQRKHEEEMFPTYYRSNSRRKLNRLCKEAGLQVKRLETFEGLPYYLTRYWPLFLCGVLYERIVNLTSMFEWMRQKIVLEAQKPHE